MHRPSSSPTRPATCRAIANSPPPWTVERKREYVDWAKAVVAGLPVKPTALLAQFEEAARLASESIEERG